MQLKAVIVVDPAQADPCAHRAAPSLTALERVANRSILQHALEGLDTADVSGVIVTGEADSLIEVRTCLEDEGRRPGGIQYAVRRGGTTLSSTLRAVAPLVGESACVIQPADGLLESSIGSLVDQVDHAGGLVVFTIPEGGPLRTPRDRSSAQLTQSIANTAWETTELGVFAPGVLRRASELEGQIDKAVSSGAGHCGAASEISVRLQEIDGWCRYRGDRQDLLALNRMALDRLVPSIPAEFARHNRLEGRLSLDQTASIRDSVIIGPAVIGPGAVVHNAYIGPWTSIGAGARIEGAEIEQSIVSSRASVTHVGGRLVASIVGQDARVFRDFSLPRALRLWVGDGDQVALC